MVRSRFHLTLLPGEPRARCVAVAELVAVCLGERLCDRPLRDQVVVVGSVGSGLRWGCDDCLGLFGCEGFNCSRVPRRPPSRTVAFHREVREHQHTDAAGGALEAASDIGGMILPGLIEVRQDDHTGAGQGG